MEEIQLTQKVLEHAMIFISQASQLEFWISDNHTTTTGFSNFLATRKSF